MTRRKAVGGSSRHVPLCETKAQTCCVIAYFTYPAARPMTDDAFFDTGVRIACAGPRRCSIASPIRGRHSLDLNIALGTLIDLVRGQTAAYPRR